MILQSTIKKLTRGWAAVKIRYPLAQALDSSNALATIFGIGALFLFIFSIFWAFGLPQKYLNLRPLSGIPEGLLTTVIEVSILLILGVCFLLSKAVSASEHTRLDLKKYENIDGIFVLGFGSCAPPKVRIFTKVEDHYRLNSLIETCLRRLEFDKEEFYLVEAGSLDIPKLTLKSLELRDGCSLDIELGAADFHDIFFTHYSPDLLISRQSAADSDKEPVTLRNITKKSLSSYYESQASNWTGNHRKFVPSNVLPNPIGLSGIVIVEVEGVRKVILRRRGGHEVAANNSLEWSFAGLLEATDWLHVESISLEDFIFPELEDEILRDFPALKGAEGPIVTPIGMVINPLYLFQPELFVVVHFTLETETPFAPVSKSEGRFLISDIADLESVFDANNLKNLCRPGLALLRGSGFLNAEKDDLVTMEAGACDEMRALCSQEQEC